jgi:predicted nuclease of predicted toxin-antitoxin system
VKFLVDNQLPLALARFLSEKGFNCQHVQDVGLDEAGDAVIWARAESEGMVVVTKDEDFVFLASRAGQSARVVWVRMGNCRNDTLLDAFGQLLPQIVEALDTGNRVVEIR